MSSLTCCRRLRDVWLLWLSVGLRDGRCVMRLVPWILTQSKPWTFGFVTCVTCGGLKCPSRMTALNLRTDPSCFFCGYAQGTFAHQWYACPGMFPIASRREHAPILSQARVAWSLMKPTRPCSGPLGFQVCPILRCSSLERRRLQIGKRNTTLGWAIIDKGRSRFWSRITWMDLLSTQRLLNCDVQDGASLSRNPRNRDNGPRAQTAGRKVRLSCW